MSDVTLDSNIFFDRAKKIFDAWEVSCAVLWSYFS